METVSWRFCLTVWAGMAIALVHSYFYWNLAMAPKLPLPPPIWR